MVEKLNEEISDSSLKFGIWYAGHKILLRKIFIIVFSVLIVLLYIFNLYTSLNLFVSEKNDDIKILSSLLANPSESSIAQNRFKPQDIQIGGVTILNHANNKSDIVAEIINPNLNYYAKNIRYSFSDGSKILAQGDTYLWPQEKRYVVAYSVDDVNSLVGASMQFEKTVWKRMNDFKKNQLEAVNFPIVMSGYVPGRFLAGDKSIPGSVKFSIENQTINNYWDVGIIAILFNGSGVVGSAYSQLHTFYSLEKIFVDMKIINEPALVTGVELYPEVNVLDPNVFLRNVEIIGDIK